MQLPLYRHGRQAESLFDILGHDEVDATSAVGFVCSRSPRLAEVIVQLAGIDASSGADIVRLEERTDLLHRSDIELDVGSDRVVVEAKVGFDIPTVEQLRRYLPRVAGHQGHFVTLTNARKLAAVEIGDVIDGVPVSHLSWRGLYEQTRTVSADARGTERFLLNELVVYLRGIMAARDIQSNRVYVVSLGQAKVAETDMDFIDVVLKYGRYFHPAHGVRGFPRFPPNYLGFRFDGKLQSIRYVQDAAVYNMRVDEPEGLPDLRHETWWTGDAARADHVLYTLGPPIVPSREVRTGNLYRAARVWAALDLLLTCDTIAEAAEKTRLREEAL
jgi:hypothetical protein